MRLRSYLVDQLFCYNIKSWITLPKRLWTDFYRQSVWSLRYSNDKTSNIQTNCFESESNQWQVLSVGIIESCCQKRGVHKAWMSSPYIYFHQLPWAFFQKLLWPSWKTFLMKKSAVRVIRERLWLKLNFPPESPRIIALESQNIFLKVAKTICAVSKLNKGETVWIKAGIYESLEHLIKAIKTSTGLTKFNHQYKKIKGDLVLLFGKKRITFPDKKFQAFWALKESKMAHAIILSLKC